ncbi:glia maturation factor beta [Anaeromyces robustus]|uniref:Glia maturation factor beta n=1 Tax=Anaeromyces robustus TaxID=1754192 RepID=A0A1Y1WVQ2_9FUNG|nr:glia maturation factor beta [Anaeromyces robustus]|eukprot:ORX77204.1 glia maturation factor beta [Anaeromyces robustus]
MNTNVFQIDPELKKSIRKFRTKRSKNHTALLIRIDEEKLLIEEDELIEDVNLDEFCNDLPDVDPRYILLSYNRVHEDGRLSNPLIFICYIPEGIPTQTTMLYSSAKNLVQNESLINGKALELRDATDFDEDWLLSQI